MIMVFLGAIWAIFRYRQILSTNMFLAATGLSALAIFVKPVCIFPIWLAFLFTRTPDQNVEPALQHTHTAVFLLLTFLPSLIYYGYGIFIADFLKNQAGSAFQLHLLTKGFFWHGWLRLASEVVGQGALVVSILGIVLAPSQLAKRLLLALWAGYFAFGLVFAYHIYTHNYYHLMLIPIVAISLGASASALINSLTGASRYWRQLVWGALAFAILLSVVDAIVKLKSPVGEFRAKLYEEVGEHVGHSVKTIFLTWNYGNPLQYHGKIAGSNWPVLAGSGNGSPRGKELLDSMLSEESPEYFIITDYAQFLTQKDLVAALSSYPVLVSTHKYRIYDLRKTVDNGTQEGAGAGNKE